MLYGSVLVGFKIFKLLISILIYNVCDCEFCDFYVLFKNAFWQCIGWVLNKLLISVVIHVFLKCKTIFLL